MLPSYLHEIPLASLIHFEGYPNDNNTWSSSPLNIVPYIVVCSSVHPVYNIVPSGAHIVASYGREFFYSVNNAKSILACLSTLYVLRPLNTQNYC